MSDMNHKIPEVSEEATSQAKRRGCPVVLVSDLGDEEEDFATWPEAGDTGVIINTGGGAATVAFDDHEELHVVDLYDIRIDPTDRVGRACLAWALEAADPRLRCLRACEHVTRRQDGVGSLMEHGELFAMDGSFFRRLLDLIAHLDPTDDARLPDGSRWVDAAALVLVANHMLTADEVTP